MRTLIATLLLGVVLAGCGEPEGAEGKSVSVDQLNKVSQANAVDDGVKAPAPPADSAPGKR